MRGRDDDDHNKLEKDMTRINPSSVIRPGVNTIKGPMKTKPNTAP